MKTRQVNITLPYKWIRELKRQAKIKEFDEKKLYNMQDLIRIAIKERYQLEEEEQNGESQVT